MECCAKKAGISLACVLLISIVGPKYLAAEGMNVEERIVRLETCANAAGISGEYGTRFVRSGYSEDVYVMAGQSVSVGQAQLANTCIDEWRAEEEG